MSNPNTLPFGKEALQAVIDVVADKMTYELAATLLVAIPKSPSSADNTFLDCIICVARSAYLVGYADGLEVYDEAMGAGEVDAEKITGGIERMTDEEYSETIKRACELFKLTHRGHPIPRKTIEQIADADKWSDPLDKLAAYEASGYEPEDIPNRADERRYNLINTLQAAGNDLDEKQARLFTSLQAITDGEYNVGYANGSADERARRTPRRKHE
ncbi:MAG: hypothetical protein FWG94_11985 [Oscillospiraceae bacterium]|nr:hypothetical protein [Oscillospiraceae bacterium]